jgi:alkylation response protein AidB-like acyl-CoA dehydrogenase
MQFAFNEDQLAIADTARQMLVETCAPTNLRALLSREGPHDAARLEAIRAMGLFGMLAPESCGGLGLAPTEFALIAEAAGYVALPEPLIEQAGVAIPLLAALQDDRGWLKAATGDQLIAVGSPINPLVLDADSAAALLLADGEDVHLVERHAVQLVRADSIDPLRRLYRVQWAPTRATRVGRGWSQAIDLGALWTAGQLIGLAQRAVDLAVAYAKQRIQFGKPIGSYQAVKHLLAGAQVKIEFARPVFHAAAAEAAASPGEWARISHAKLAATQAADTAMRASLQVHGAMGYTWECDLHFYLKRALALGYSWGDAAYHRARVIRRLRTLPIGPEFTFATEFGAHLELAKSPVTAGENHGPLQLPRADTSATRTRG